MSGKSELGECSTAENNRQEEGGRAAKRKPKAKEERRDTNGDV